MLAVSMAAEELTPLPSGTCRRRRRFSRPTSAASRARRASTRKTPATYDDPVRCDGSATVREHPPRPVVADRHATRRAARRAESCTGGRPRLTISSTGRSMPLHRRERGFGDRALQARANPNSRRCRPSRRAVLAPATPSARRRLEQALRPERVAERVELSAHVRHRVSPTRGGHRSIRARAAPPAAAARSVRGCAALA